jgi:hypothetical protein
MEANSDYYLVRQVKLQVYKITDLGDQIKIWMSNGPRKMIKFSTLGNLPATEIEKVSRVIKNKANEMGLEVVQETAQIA